MNLMPCNNDIFLTISYPARHITGTIFKIEELVSIKYYSPLSTLTGILCAF